MLRKNKEAIVREQIGLRGLISRTQGKAIDSKGSKAMSVERGPVEIGKTTKSFEEKLEMERKIFEQAAQSRENDIVIAKIDLQKIHFKNLRCVMGHDLASAYEVFELLNKSVVFYYKNLPYEIPTEYSHLRTVPNSELRILVSRVMAAFDEVFYIQSCRQHIIDIAQSDIFAGVKLDRSCFYSDLATSCSISRTMVARPMLNFQHKLIQLIDIKQNKIEHIRSNIEVVAFVIKKLRQLPMHDKIELITNDSIIMSENSQVVAVGFGTENITPLLTQVHHANGCFYEDVPLCVHLVQSAWLLITELKRRGLQLLPFKPWSLGLKANGQDFPELIVLDVIANLSPLANVKTPHVRRTQLQRYYKCYKGTMENHTCTRLMVMIFSCQKQEIHAQLRIAWQCSFAL